MAGHKQNLIFNKNINFQAQYYAELAICLVIIKLGVEILSGVLL